MGLDQYAHLRQTPNQDEFYWRKHARLQQFMAQEFEKQNGANTEHNTVDQLQSLGFNGGQGGVKITEDVLARLEEAVKNKYYEYFAHDGFFWGQQFQEEAAKEYEAQDKKFIEWAKEKIKNGEEVIYDCSW